MSEYDKELFDWPWDWEGNLVDSSMRARDYGELLRCLRDWAIRALEVCGLIIGLSALLVIISFFSFLDWVFAYEYH